jgi:outer membrane protein TolC
MPVLLPVRDADQATSKYDDRPLPTRAGDTISRVVKPLLKVDSSARTPLPAILALLATLLGAPSAAAQTAGFSSGTNASRSTVNVGSAASSVDASGLLGLKEPQGEVPVLTLQDVIRTALDNAPDARLATQRVVQQDASLRRAWALLLPTLSVGAAYTHTCTGGERGVDCGDRTANFADPEQVDQQSLLFQTLADVMGVAANAATDPAQAADFRARQLELEAAAADIKNTDVTPVVVQPASQLSGQVTLSLPLFNPRAYPALLNAWDGQSAARLALDQARQALVLSVMRAYYAAVTAERVKFASARQVELAAAQREAVAARVAASTQPILAEKRATLELLRAKQTLAQAGAAADNAVAVIGALMGRQERFVLSPPAADREPAIDVVDANRLVDTALQERLELKTQRTAVTIAQRGTLDAWMQFMPSVGLTASARATSFTQGFVRDPVTGVLTISATLPLYDGGLRYASLDESTSRATEERIRLQQLEDRVASQVRGNIRDVSVRIEANALAQEALVVAKEAQAQAQALFDAGVGTSLDLTETNVAVFATETEALRAELDLAMARIGLRFAVGDSLTDTDG